MTPSEQNAAAGAWADTDPAGALQAICSAGSLRALRHAYVALRREQPDARRRGVREAVRIVRLAVRALAGGGRLVSPDAFLFVNGINIAADAVVMVVGDGQSRTVFTGQLITTLASVPDRTCRADAHLDTRPNTPASDGAARGVGEGAGRVMDRRCEPLPGALSTRQAADRLRAGCHATRPERAEGGSCMAQGGGRGRRVVPTAAAKAIRAAHEKGRKG